MAAGTVVYQTAVTATPPNNLPVMADAVRDAVHGDGTAQYIKIMDGATGGTAKAGVTDTFGMSVDITRVQGTVQALGTVRTLPPTGGLGESFFGTLFTAGQTNGTLVAAPASGTYIRVYDIIVSGSAAGTAFLEFGDGTTFGPIIAAANQGFVFNSARGVRTRGTALDILFNAASGTWGVTVNYVLEN